MQTFNKKKWFLVITRTLLVTFVVGNGISWLLGAKPIKFPQWQYSTADHAVLVELYSGRVQLDEVSQAFTLAMIYFLYNRLDQAEEIISAAYRKQPANISIKALQAAIAAKQAGAMLDLAFGQIKLYQLKQALKTLRQCASQAPSQLDIQLLALWAFVSVPTIDNSAQEGLVIAARLEQQLLASTKSIPPEMTASAWLAITRLYLYLSEQRGKEQHSWEQKAKQAWQHYQSITVYPIWLEKEQQEVVAAFLEKT